MNFIIEQQYIIVEYYNAFRLMSWTHEKQSLNVATNKQS